MIRARTLADLVDRYDAFLVDQFGVLLDGAGAYGHARCALDELHARGKPVLLVSNSGKRSAANIARLLHLGFSRATYIDALTSGEVAHVAIAQRIGREIARGARVWVETTDDSAQPLLGLDLAAAANPAEADLVWIAGCRPLTHSLDDYAHALQPAAARRTPAICSNPDQTMLTPSGKGFGAGAVAQAYERLGGEVEWFGKPFPAIYQEALRRLGSVDPARVLAIGDSPAHDILGGARAGIGTCLVRTGIHDAESEAELMARCEAAGAEPDALLPRFAF
jgi:HAD superfamily hydrolase (TIGR01459 family)